MATKTIPIVIATMEEPVRNGLVASIARPGGNITGLDFQPPDLQGKRLQFFKEAFPTISRLAVLIDSAGRPLTREIEMIAAESAAQALSIRLQPVIEVKSAEEIAGAFKAIASDGADGILEVGGTMFFANRIEMAERALKSRIPVMTNGDFRYWHVCDMPIVSSNVRFQDAGSTGRRNTGVKSLCWGFKLQGLTWSFV
jgi:putative ABC transport system substrate-binding protein